MRFERETIATQASHHRLGLQRLLFTLALLTFAGFTLATELPDGRESEGERPRRTSESWRERGRRPWGHTSITPRTPRRT